jgi:hypothetical protein
MAGSLLVNLGAYIIAQRAHVLSFVPSRTFFILAVFNRMTTRCFSFARGGTAVARPRLLVGRSASAICRPPRRFVPLSVFAAPLLLYGAYLLWKVYYYGSLFPARFTPNRLLLRIIIRV